MLPENGHAPLTRFQDAGLRPARRGLDVGVLTELPRYVWQQRHKRPPQVRRFERPVPNALWQTDIFTFNLKRMYKVYLIGIIDDHSRYLVGWGLYRQQTADAVMEVVKGAIGQWGAPREILSDNGRQFVAWRGTLSYLAVELEIMRNTEEQ